MNIQESEILSLLLDRPYENQRLLAEQTGHSLGVVNRSIRNLTEQGLLDKRGQPTDAARSFAAERSPKRAIILAAGFAARMVPINLDTPKALLEIDGEPLIERQIRQLHAVGIREIYVIVGYLKERFDDLIDRYGVTLIVSEHYATKNNLHSLRKALDHLENAYVVPCDLWCRENPFRARELYSWYMVSDAEDPDSAVRVNRKQQLVLTEPGKTGNAMLGIAYLTAQDAAAVRDRAARLCADRRHDGDFWESVLFCEDRMTIPARIVSARDVVEINTYEQLRDLDGSSDHLQHDAIAAVCETFCVPAEEITGITMLKKGMTNRSFLFGCRGKKYIMRSPGEGTDKLINRRQEADVYRTILDRGLCDDVLYFDPDTGYKITALLEDARVCDPECAEDVAACMKKLREFHAMKLRVGHAFDLFGQLEFYESLRGGTPSAYRDYAQTKERVLSLRPFIERHAGEPILTHIDAVPDNFLFTENGLRLIDWEYAGMQDPHVDAAMFAIYALYDRAQIDRLIDLYFENACPRETRIKIYCYVAVCGLLWSNWCEYKRTLGVEFGEYSLRQYRYAKDFSKLALAEMEDV